MTQIPVSGRLMLDIDGCTLTDEDRELLQQSDVGGVILFARNIISREQVCQLSADIRSIAPRCLLAVDQEGGRVQRLRDGYTRLPPMQVLGDFALKSTALQDAESGLKLLRDCGWLMASEVIASGLDISFAPVLDIDRELSTIIGDRAFADQPEQVARFAAAFIQGMQEAGMAATGKHFPGHGGVVADSHLELPCDNRSMDELQARDLIPFVALSEQLAGIMPGHILFPEVDADPVGFSRYWLNTVLRQQLGYDGVIFSDDLSMKGADVAGGYAEKTRAALDAGCDMVLVCNAREGALEALDFLRENAIGGSARIGAMRAARTIEWTELENHPRRRHTMLQLQQLSDQQ